MCLMKKLCIIFKQDCRMKLEFMFWFSSLQPWKLHVKLLTELVEYYSKHQSAYANKAQAKAKANTATKTLKSIPIASIFHTSDSRNHRT